MPTHGRRSGNGGSRLLVRRDREARARVFLGAPYPDGENPLYWIGKRFPGNCDRRGVGRDESAVRRPKGWDRALLRREGGISSHGQFALRMPREHLPQSDGGIRDEASRERRGA